MPPAGDRAPEEGGSWAQLDAAGQWVLHENPSLRGMWSWREQREVRGGINKWWWRCSVRERDTWWEKGNAYFPLGLHRIHLNIWGGKGVKKKKA